MSLFSFFCFRVFFFWYLVDVAVSVMFVCVFFFDEP